MPIDSTEFAMAAEIGGVLAVETCMAVVAVAEEHAAEHGGWSTGRHQQYPTTDLPLSHLDAAKHASVAAVSRALRDALLPAFAHAFPCNDDVRDSNPHIVLRGALLTTSVRVPRDSNPRPSRRPPRAPRRSPR